MPITTDALFLEILAGPRTGSTVKVTRDRTVWFGRQSDADVAIREDTFLSRQHFRIGWRSGAPFAEDLGSANGTFVNGEPIQIAHLVDGDEITAGTSRFKVRYPPPQTKPAPEALAALPAEENTRLMPRRASVGLRGGVESTGAATGPTASMRYPGEASGISGEARLAEPAEVQQLDVSPVMAIRNYTRFLAGTLVWEDARGRNGLTIIIKGTFCITPADRSRFCETPWPIFSADEHYGGDPLASVRFESDLVPYKPRADVVLVGYAHAPDGHPVTQTDVALRVGTLSRAIRVFGDREWRFVRSTGLLTATRPVPFAVMDLTYERAFGGFDPANSAFCASNPVGQGFFAADPGATANGRPLPNLEDPADPIRSWRSHPKPVGFAFYGRGWRPRLRYAGTYDDHYRSQKAPAQPDDFSYALFCGAHPDLQLPQQLRGDEPVELQNLSPKSRLAFSLPDVRPEVVITRWPRTEGQGSGAHNLAPRKEAAGPAISAHETVQMRLDTLVLVPEEGLFYEVFRGVCRLHALDPTEIADITICYANS